MTDGEFFSARLAPGYAYTFVFLRHLYLSAAVFLAVVWQHYARSTGEQDYTSYESAIKANARFAAGYNSDVWYLGAGFITGFRSFAIDIADAGFFYDVAQLRLWGGTRFDIFRSKKKKK